MKIFDPKDYTKLWTMEKFVEKQKKKRKKDKNPPRISNDSYFVKLSTVVSNGKHGEQS